MKPQASLNKSPEEALCGLEIAHPQQRLEAPRHSIPRALEERSLNGRLQGKALFSLLQGGQRPALIWHWNFHDSSDRSEYREHAK
jgi:hypothetical protein